MKNVAFSIFAAVLLSPAYGHAQTARPSFEVASIKPNKSGSTSSGFSTSPGYFSATSTTLKGLIMQSYEVLEFQVIGGPDWINTEPFDVQARAESGDIPSRSGQRDSSRPTMMQLMIQSLLEDRFQLRLHHEMRQLPVYRLVIAKDGSKLKATVDGQLGPGNLTPGSSRTNGSNGKIEMSGSGISAAALAVMLSRQLRQTVIDDTNLNGKYDFTINWSLSAGVASSVDSDGPSIFTALQEQLGLKLESARGPVDVIVIDHVERPSEN